MKRTYCKIESCNTILPTGRRGKKPVYCEKCRRERKIESDRNRRIRLKEEGQTWIDNRESETRQEVIEQALSLPIIPFIPNTRSQYGWMS